MSGALASSAPPAIHATVSAASVPAATAVGVHNDTQLLSSPAGAPASSEQFDELADLDEMLDDEEQRDADERAARRAGRTPAPDEDEDAPGGVEELDEEEEAMDVEPSAAAADKAITDGTNTAAARVPRLRWSANPELASTQAASYRGPLSAPQVLSFLAQDLSPAARRSLLAQHPPTHNFHLLHFLGLHTVPPESRRGRRARAPPDAAELFERWQCRCCHALLHVPPRKQGNLFAHVLGTRRQAGCLARRYAQRVEEFDVPEDYVLMEEGEEEAGKREGGRRRRRRHGTDDDVQAAGAEPEQAIDTSTIPPAAVSASASAPLPLPADAAAPAPRRRGRPPGSGRGGRGGSSSSSGANRGVDMHAPLAAASACPSTTTTTVPSALSGPSVLGKRKPSSPAAGASSGPSLSPPPSSATEESMQVVSAPAKRPALMAGVQAAQAAGGGGVRVSEFTGLGTRQAAVAAALAVPDVRARAVAAVAPSTRPAAPAPAPAPARPIASSPATSTDPSQSSTLALALRHLASQPVFALATTPSPGALRILAATPACVLLTGRAREDLAGKPLVQVLAGEEVGVVRRMARDVLSAALVQVEEEEEEEEDGGPTASPSKTSTLNGATTYAVLASEPPQDWSTRSPRPHALAQLQLRVRHAYGYYDPYLVRAHVGTLPGFSAGDPETHAARAYVVWTFLKVGNPQAAMPALRVQP